MGGVILFAQICATGYLAAWMTAGVKDNILYPSVNRTFTSMVLHMDRIEEMYPDDFKRIGHRRISSQFLQNAAFMFIVACESVATILLWVGVAWLTAALFGWANLEIAKSAALIGCIAFTAVWAGFLVIGNHFGYWLTHEAAQNTHFNLMIWGIVTMFFVAAA